MNDEIKRFDRFTLHIDSYEFRKQMKNMDFLRFGTAQITPFVGHYDQNCLF